MSLEQTLTEIANIYGFQIYFYKVTEATYGSRLIQVKDVTGVCNYTHQYINIYENPKATICPVKRICVIAHEIGHAIDYGINHSNDYWDPTSQFPELIAWANAKRLLKRLSFTEWEKYDEYRRKALATYGYQGP